MIGKEGRVWEGFWKGQEGAMGLGVRTSLIPSPACLSAHQQGSSAFNLTLLLLPALFFLSFCPHTQALLEDAGGLISAGQIQEKKYCLNQDRA